MRCAATKLQGWRNPTSHAAFSDIELKQKLDKDTFELEDGWAWEVRHVLHVGGGVVLCADVCFIANEKAHTHTHTLSLSHPRACVQGDWEVDLSRPCDHEGWCK